MGTQNSIYMHVQIINLHSRLKNHAPAMLNGRGNYLFDRNLQGTPKRGKHPLVLFTRAAQWTIMYSSPHGQSCLYTGHMTPGKGAISIWIIFEWGYSVSWFSSTYLSTKTADRPQWAWLSQTGVQLQFQAIYLVALHVVAVNEQKSVVSVSVYIYEV